MASPLIASDQEMPALFEIFDPMGMNSFVYEKFRMSNVVYDT